MVRFATSQAPEAASSKSITPLKIGKNDGTREMIRLAASATQAGIKKYSLG
jgi:hypothetical protein